MVKWLSQAAFPEYGTKVSICARAYMRLSRHNDRRCTTLTPRHCNVWAEVSAAKKDQVGLPIEPTDVSHDGAASQINR